MKAGILGVALATVMACGWMGSAQASTLNFDLETRSMFDDYLSGDVAGSLTVDRGTATISYIANYTKVIDPDTSGSVVTGSYSNIFSSIIDLSSSQNGNGVVLSFGDGSVSLSFSLLKAGSILLPNTDDVRFGGENTPYGGTFGEINFSGSLAYADLITPVPLPASSPLFGAALIVLGATGYAWRRKPINQG